MLYKKVKYPDGIEADEIEEMEHIAERLQIGMDAAEYVMLLEHKIERMEKKINELWDDWQQQ